MTSSGEIQLAPGAAEQNGEAREQIARLENRIEELAAAIESCRKVMLISRIAIAGGGLLALAMMLGAIRFEPMAIAGALTAVIGGIVLLGSNKSTAEEATAALRAAEEQRAGLIGRIELRVVGEERA